MENETSFRSTRIAPSDQGDLHEVVEPDHAHVRPGVACISVSLIEALGMEAASEDYSDNEHDHGNISAALIYSKEEEEDITQDDERQRQRADHLKRELHAVECTPCLNTRIGAVVEDCSKVGDFVALGGKVV